MPDLDTRSKHEKELSALLLYLLGQEEERVRRGIRDGLQFERDLRGAAIPVLSSTYLQAAEQLQRELKQPFNRIQWEAEANRWADQYARQLASEIAATTREGVAAAVQKAQQEGAILDELWAGLFNEVRAENIGITETTRAITAGERGLIQKYTIASGNLTSLMVPVWQIEDASACPVCQRLNGGEEADWGETFRDGPPAHPRCRCFLRWRFTYI